MVSIQQRTQARDIARTMWQKGDFDTIAQLAGTRPAASLVRFAQVRPGESVLDVATGTGVVAITAARQGASVTGVDLAPSLLERAEQKARAANVGIKWFDADAQEMPFPDASFDVVLSQFGHMFAPDPAATVAEMLRVLRPGGRIAFSTWPPELMVGRMFAVNAQYVPPPPTFPSPVLWGSVDVVRERLGDRVRDVTFRRDATFFPVAAPQHFRTVFEGVFGPVMQAVETLRPTPDRLAAWRDAFDDLAAQYFEDNAVRQDYLMTRAVKV